MTIKVKKILQPCYQLNENGRFIIENYNHSKPFSNFFPGVAGIWGIPMWAFYVNRGQCMASFGIESKDKAIMEFQPANKSYRQTALQGFRTFIKVKSGAKTVVWEPFQNHLEGTSFKKTQTLSMSAHDLILTEVNQDLGLTAEVNYFTLPDEPYAALVRRLTIKNTGKKAYTIELIDGLPVIVPYGIKDWLNKNLARTIEAWVKVRNLKQKAPYYQLTVEVSDKPEVTHIEDGNFFFSFDSSSSGRPLLNPIVDADAVFGSAVGFSAPVAFYTNTFKFPKRQETSNRMPAAMAHTQFVLKPKGEKGITSLYGYAHSQVQLDSVVRKVTQDGFIDQKAKRNQVIIDEIKNYVLTKSSSKEFDLYAGQTFLDNVLRGGLPVSLKTGDGHVAFNVFSRKHGDLERDYNFFFVAPTFFSQGNGNYRDVNQNRRNDVWFNAHVRSSHLMTFLNLSQADGYNPLVVKGVSFTVHDAAALDKLIAEYIGKKDADRMKAFMKKSFTSGSLLKFIDRDLVDMKLDSRAFLGHILEICRKEESADHGEGFWSDHWTYNLDLIESYLSVYPEDLKDLLLKNKAFHFYYNRHYVLPRKRRYILTDRGVRQYESVACLMDAHDGLLKTKNGEGDVYETHLACKLLCLIANKAATLDPSGIGVEMEADKPNWYDALNGLPALLGSSVSETFELKRLAVFLINALDQIGMAEDTSLALFEELANFITGLTHLLSLESDPVIYWQKSNDVKEHYREYIRRGITGVEAKLSIAEIKHFLHLVIERTDKGTRAAKNPKGFMGTYFYHDVVKYTSVEDAGETAHQFVHPVVFKKHVLPPFLEGYVHALRVESNPARARKIYEEVRGSDLFDAKLKMYKVNASLSGESEEIGRARIFPRGWLENESIWLHMEYKYLLELIRGGLYEEFYNDFKTVLVPYLKPECYGRSILENSSFLVSSAHEDKNLHGQGFVARLSGSTAEFVHIWLLMNVGRRPFSLNSKGDLVFTLNPALPGWLFTKVKTAFDYYGLNGQLTTAEMPKNCYAFNLFGSTLVVYHNPSRHDTFGADQFSIDSIRLTYPETTEEVVINSKSVSGDYARDIRDRKVARIDVFLK